MLRDQLIMDCVLIALTQFGIGHVLTQYSMFLPVCQAGILCSNKREFLLVLGVQFSHDGIDGVVVNG